MRLFWDRLDQTWVHNNDQGDYTFGIDKLPVYFKNIQPSNRYIPFQLSSQNNHLGPLVGILCSKKNGQEVIGNGLLFRKLQKYLLKNGCLSFIFTPEDVRQDFIEGHMYLPQSDVWMKIKTPYPDVVYNRISLRKTEKDIVTNLLIGKFINKGIPFFNPCFIDKYDLATLFQKNSQLRPFLPSTIPLEDFKILVDFIEHHKTIYLKPCLSSKGKGIFRLHLATNKHIQVHGIDNSYSFQSFESFWEWWKSSQAEKTYIAQKAITFATHEGNRFDFRILCHFDEGEYKVTGVGVRLSTSQNVTTHLPNGGTFVSYQLVQSKEHDQFIQKITPLIGKALTDRYGFFGEFSIDAGISTSGDYFVYEVNSKPMSFEEEHIEENKLNKLCKLFYYCSNLNSLQHEGT